MINKIIHWLIYFVLFVLIQTLVLNHIHFLRIATPFLYLYVLLKMPIGNYSTNLILSFLLGLTIDLFMGTAGMHAAACTFVSLLRNPIIKILQGSDLPKDLYPSTYTFGMKSFFRYCFFIIFIHHCTLYLIESISFLDPLYLALRIGVSTILTTFFVFVVEVLNPASYHNAES